MAFHILAYDSPLFSHSPHDPKQQHHAQPTQHDGGTLVFANGAGNFVYPQDLISNLQPVPVDQLTAESSNALQQQQQPQQNNVQLQNGKLALTFCLSCKFLSMYDF